jgi:hypothetical protein
MKIDKAVIDAGIDKILAHGPFQDIKGKERASAKKVKKRSEKQASKTKRK